MWLLTVVNGAIVCVGLNPACQEANNAKDEVSESKIDTKTHSYL